MSIISVKLPLSPGMSEHTWIRFDALDDLREKFKEAGARSIHLEALGIYDDVSQHRQYVPVEEFSEADLCWLRERDVGEQRYAVLIDRLNPWA